MFSPLCPLSSIFVRPKSLGQFMARGNSKLLLPTTPILQSHSPRGLQSEALLAENPVKGRAVGGQQRQAVGADGAADVLPDGVEQIRGHLHLVRRHTAAPGQQEVRFLRGYRRGDGSS